MGGRTHTAPRTNLVSQFRKHRGQMSDREVLQLVQDLSQVRWLKDSNHLKEKKEITYDKREIYTALKDKDILFNSIVEYNEKRGNNRWVQRVLLRLPKKIETTNYVGELKGRVKTYSQLCVVIDLTTKEIITVYYNDTRDNHQTLDLNKYTKGLEVRKIKKGGYQEVNKGVPSTNPIRGKG